MYAVILINARTIVNPAQEPRDVHEAELSDRACHTASLPAKGTAFQGHGQFLSVPDKTDYKKSLSPVRMLKITYMDCLWNYKFLGW